MRLSLLIAACLAVLLATAHSYLGERYLLMRLFRRDALPKLLGSVEFTKRTLRFAWHITSIAWLGLASLIVVLAASSPGGSHLTQARLVAGVFGLSGAVALFGSRGRHLSWVVFFAIAGLVWFGYP
jgi:hypothetical protein